MFSPTTSTTQLRASVGVVQISVRRVADAGGTGPAVVIGRFILMLYPALTMSPVNSSTGCPEPPACPPIQGTPLSPLAVSTASLAVTASLPPTPIWSFQSLPLDSVMRSA